MSEHHTIFPAFAMFAGGLIAADEPASAETASTPAAAAIRREGMVLDMRFLSRRRRSRSLLLSEVGLAHTLVLAQRLCVAGEGNRACLEDVAAVGDVKGHQRV